MEGHLAMGEFAADMPRDSNGWFLFPRDVEKRRGLFPDKVFEHPAKANLFLTEELVLYLSNEGDTVLDPFGGTGTTMVAAIWGRNVVVIDVEPQYCDLMNEAAEEWQQVKFRGSPLLGSIKVVQGDCRQVLPIPCNAVITSPPYSIALGGSTGLKDVGRSNVQGSLSAYSGADASSLNMGRLNPFYFEQAMAKVYKGLADSLSPGGSLALITKDFVRGGSRFMLSEGIIRQASRCGLKLQDWFKWKTPGTAQRKLMASKGSQVIEDEDILCFRKV
jgi:DNA modification methylase